VPLQILACTIIMLKDGRRSSADGLEMTPQAIDEATVPFDGRILFFRRDREASGFLSHCQA
jgi:hypothetical protein